MKYNGFITAWDSYDESKQTYENLTSRLLKEEQRLTQTEELNMAFSAVDIRKSEKARSEESYKSKHPNKKNVECFYCRKKLYKENQIEENKTSKYQALVVENKNIFVVDDEDDWLADSAASIHMSYRRE